MKQRLKESCIEIFLFLSSFVSLFSILAIIVVLIVESIPFFKQVSIVEFLTGREWTPLFAEKRFGILPLICGTFLVTFLSAVFGLPIGLLSAIYLSEFASAKMRKVLKPIMEVLAGIPSIVYGYFALKFITPYIVQKIFPGTNVFNALSAGFVVGVMIIPTVSSLSEDAIHSVPVSLREGSFALGANKLQTIFRVVIPASLSGIAASFILAVSRAIGETMAVTIAAGQIPNLTLNPLEAVETLTAYIAQVGIGDTPYGSLEYTTIFSVGLVLFVITLFVNMVAIFIRERFKKVVSEL